MKYKPEQEQALITRVLSMKYSSEEFCEFMFPWGQPGPLQHVRIRKWQRSLFREIDQHVREQAAYIEAGRFDKVEVFQKALVSGRGPGKSAALGMLNCWHQSTHLGASTTITANTELQLKTKTFPEQAKWFTLALNSHWWEIGSLYIRPQKWLADTIQEQLKISSKYWATEGQNWLEEQPDAFAGTHNTYGLFVAFDEASGIPESIWSVTKGFFTEISPFRFWIAFSNGRNNKGAFFNRCTDPKFAPYWKPQSIDIRTVEGLDQSFAREVEATYGRDSDEFRIEVEGKFPKTGSGQLIPYAIIDEAAKRPLAPFPDEDAPLVMGVDPAPRSGKTVIRFVQGRDARSIAPVKLHGKDNNVIAETIANLVQEHDPDGVVIDAGNGTGVIDILSKQYGINVLEVWPGASQTNTSEWAYTQGAIWSNMAKWLENGGCIDDDPDLKRDLGARTWDFQGGRDSGRKVLNSKREMAKDGIPSPDDGDALGLALWAKVPRRSLRARRSKSKFTIRRAHGVQDWDFA